jgi:hypothetical protein
LFSQEYANRTYINDSTAQMFSDDQMMTPLSNPLSHITPIQRNPNEKSFKKCRDQYPTPVVTSAKHSLDNVQSTTVNGHPSTSTPKNTTSDCSTTTPSATVSNTNAMNQQDISSYSTLTVEEVKHLLLLLLNTFLK